MTLTEQLAKAMLIVLGPDEILWRDLSDEDLRETGEMLDSLMDQVIREWARRTMLRGESE